MFTHEFFSPALFQVGMTSTITQFMVFSDVFDCVLAETLLKIPICSERIFFGILLQHIFLSKASKLFKDGAKLFSTVFLKRL